MDGDLDLLTAGHPGPSHILLNDGSGRFTETSVGLPSEALRAWQLTVDVGDLDGDGDLDVVWGGFRRTGVFLQAGPRLNMPDMRPLRSN